MWRWMVGMVVVVVNERRQAQVRDQSMGWDSPAVAPADLFFLFRSSPDLFDRFFRFVSAAFVIQLSHYKSHSSLHNLKFCLVGSIDQRLSY